MTTHGQIFQEPQSREGEELLASLPAFASPSSWKVSYIVVLRHDIFHMHHMQRMCKIISPRVKIYILKVLFEHFMYVSFWFLVISSHVSQ